jgi:hypothetical protein
MTTRSDEGAKMGVVIDFADDVEGDPPLSSTMMVRVVRWHGVELGLYTMEHGPYPPHGDFDMLRYLGQVSAVQAVLATDYGRRLVPPGPIGELIPQIDELPPRALQATSPVTIDHEPVPVWETVVRGARVVLGDPRQAPFVVIYSADDELTGFPRLTTRPASSAS